MNLESNINELRKTHEIILFDGVCNLCDASVQFVLKRDPKKQFLFASLQSEVAQTFLKKQLPYFSKVDSILLVTKDTIYTKSSAALKVSKRITGLWFLLSIFLIVPKKIRDIVYDYIAKKRYAWFGKMDSCRIPTKEELERFI